MTIQSIITKFEKKGYKISRSTASGMLLLTKILAKCSSYAKAYNYFSKLINHNHNETRHT